MEIKTVCICAVHLQGLLCIQNRKMSMCGQWLCFSLCSYNASLCRLPQQSSKGDNGRHAGTVKEEEGGHALEAHAIFKITQVERSFPPNIHYETSKQPNLSAQQNNDMINDLV